MAVHARPKVLLFVPYVASARLCGTKYVNPDEGQTDLSYVIEDLSGTELHGPADAGSASTNVTVTGLSLTVGQTYTAKIRYKSSSGYSAWSPPFIARVYSSGFDLAALQTPELPGATPLPLAIAPSYRVQLEHKRGHDTHTTEAGETVRRLVQTAGDRIVRLTWTALTSGQRDTIEAVLEDALGDVYAETPRGFDFSTVPPATPEPLAGLVWLPLVGTLKRRQIGPALWEVAMDALEVRP